MNALRLPVRALVLTLAAAALPAQTTPAPDPAIPPTVVHHPNPKPHLPATPATTNPNLILIDPAHGAADNGAVFADKTLEKDITLALANRLADALKARGFSVLLTRTNATDDVPADARIDLANRSRPLACILLHAANGGHGVHLYTSALTPPGFTDPNLIIPWDTAQSAALAQSLRLTNDLATAINGIRVPLVTGRASVRPVDSLTCPAVAVEIAPIAANGDINTPASDPNYQTRVAEALASALVFWRGHAESNSSALAAKASADAQTAAGKTAADKTAAAKSDKSDKSDKTPATAKPAPKPKPPAPSNPDDPTATPRPTQARPYRPRHTSATRHGSAPNPMIPRYQRVVYWCLVAGTLLLAVLLLRGCERNHQRIAAMRDQSPIPAPTDIPSEQVSVAVANDADGSITLEAITLPLPAEPSLRARSLLERVLADDALAASAHPLPAGPALTDVFLLSLPLTPPNSQGAPAYNSNDQLQPPHSPYGDIHAPGAQLAVVNLTKAFADAHPSGIEAEDLTLRQIIATLHAILPQLEEVRFLVDGQTRDTLNGHADLTRPYSVVDPAKLIHVLSPDGNAL